MCGITGFLEHGTRADRREILARMTDRVRHRGPDEEGFYLDGPIAFGVRRLRVVDLLTGQQPMATADGAAIVIQNGEIYKFRTLRRELERLGHRPRTDSDTEVIWRRTKPRWSGT